MKIDKVELIPVSVPYKHDEISSRVSRSGITEIIIKITTDNGLVGWGESPRIASAEVILKAIESMIPMMLNQDPWQNQLLEKNVYHDSNWQWSQMTANLAYGGVDMALWDIYGQETGLPIYKLLGGNLREYVDYFYYLQWDEPDHLLKQCTEGLDKNYDVFYMKIGVNEIIEEEMIRQVRSIIGNDKKIRLDINMAWDVPKAKKLINEWNEKYNLDFVEAPVPIQPLNLMKEVNDKVDASLCINEGLWQESEFYNIINNKCADFLCCSHYFVGSIRKFVNLANYSNFMGWQICKHTHGELGLTAVIGQHLMLAIPNACDGHQQTAQNMADDILSEEIPITNSNSWGLIDKPGLGVNVDEDKLEFYHKKFLENGEYLLYGNKFPIA
jgi:glucarate dehydratase